MQYAFANIENIVTFAVGNLEKLKIKYVILWLQSFISAVIAAM